MEDIKNKAPEELTEAVTTAKKKRTVIIITLLCVITLVALLLNSLGVVNLLDPFAPEETTALVVERVRLHMPDWETDIFTLSRWLEKDRFISYKNGGETVGITDGNYARYGATVVFFGDYFDALMHGDHERLNAMYSDSWIAENGAFEEFTMQKIYGITVEAIRHYEQQQENGGYITVYDYKVTYKIMENDGTFRSDLYSDAERAQFIELSDDGYNVEITRVDYSYWYNG